MWRRLVAISSFALATGLGLTSLTEPSASLAASAASTDPPSPSGLVEQRVLVEQLQVATRVRREQVAEAQAQAVAVDAERARKAAADAAGAARAQRVTRVARVTPRPAPPSSGPVDWKAIVARHPWDVGVAERIVWCESRGNPNARNSSGAAGLFQILGGPMDPVANVARAYDMYRTRGWQPWSTSRSCWA